MSWVSVRAAASRPGSASVSAESDDESDESVLLRAAVLAWRDRKVGYEAWQSVVSAVVSWADDAARVAGSD